MYKVVEDIPYNFDVDRYGKPLVVLVDEFGGQSVIIKDDHCFVLMNGTEDRKFQKVYHWYREAAQALGKFLIDQYNASTC